MRCSYEARPGFVLKVSSPEVAHLEEDVVLLADRCRIRRSDSIHGNVGRPDAKPLDERPFETSVTSARPLRLCWIRPIGDTFS